MAKDATGRRMRPLHHKRTGRGVYWRADRNCWSARIMVTTLARGERNIFLGHFDREGDAIAARSRAIEQLEKNPNFFD